MDYIIREIKKAEYDLLNDFLYEAIYIPDGVEPPPKSIINCPELQEYVFEFGKRKDDRALVAEVQGNVVGAIWVRIMNDYGHIDNDTPSLAMSVFITKTAVKTQLFSALLQTLSATDTLIPAPRSTHYRCKFTYANVSENFPTNTTLRRKAPSPHPTPPTAHPQQS